MSKEVMVEKMSVENGSIAKLNRQQQQIEAYQQEIDRLKSIITDIIAEIDAIEMSDDTGISEGLYTAMRHAIQLDTVVDSPGKVRQSLKADLYDKLVQIKALVADKDERGLRIMQLEEGLKKQRNFLQLLNELGGLGYQKHGWIKSHIAEIDALLGIKEDKA